MRSGLSLHAPTDSTRLEREIDELSGEILERYEEVNILYRLCDCFRDMFEETEILDRLLSESARSVRARAGWVAVLNPDGALGVPRVLGGACEADPPQGRMAHGPFRAHAAASALAKRAIAENRILSLERGSGNGQSAAPLMAAPLPGKAGPLGVLLLEKTQAEEPFRSGDLRLVTAVAAFGASVVENRRLALQMKHAERIRGEIELARTIQQGLLPSRDPEVAGLQVAGLCRPAHDIGGDYFGYTHVRPGRFGITVADVSGHGIGAAIGMVMARCLIQSEAHRSGSPSRIARRVNELLNRDLTDPGMFVTAFLAVYEERTGRLRYANAGHHPPLLYRAATGTIEPLRGASLALGIEPHTRYADRAESLQRGDILVLYTDGFTEARSPREEMFGLERLKQMALSCREMSARKAVEKMVGRLAQWRAKPAFDDDITLVVARKV